MRMMINDNDDTSFLVLRPSRFDVHTGTSSRALLFKQTSDHQNLQTIRISESEINRIKLSSMHPNTYMFTYWKSKLTALSVNNEHQYILTTQIENQYSS